MCIRGNHGKECSERSQGIVTGCSSDSHEEKQGGGSNGDQLGLLSPIFLQPSPATNLLIYLLQVRFESHYSWHSIAAVSGAGSWGKEASLLVQRLEKGRFSIKPGTSFCQKHRNNIHRQVPSPCKHESDGEMTDLPGDFIATLSGGMQPV